MPLDAIIACCCCCRHGAASSHLDIDAPLLSWPCIQGRALNFVLLKVRYRYLFCRSGGLSLCAYDVLSMRWLGGEDLLPAWIEVSCGCLANTCPFRLASADFHLTFRMGARTAFCTSAGILLLTVEAKQITLTLSACNNSNL